MGKATVVFSNGSKSMAHKLDDQYERWQLRRGDLQIEQRQSIAADAAIEMFVPALPEFANMDERRTFRAGLVEKQSYLQGRLAELNLKRQTSFYPDKDYFYDRAPLALAITRLNLQVHQIAALAAANTGLTGQIKLFKAKEQDGTITVEEQIDVAALRATEKDKSQAGMLKKANQAEGEEKIEQLQRVIDDQHKWLNAVQGKLIAAYERIIELQSER